HVLPSMVRRRGASISRTGQDPHPSPGSGLQALAATNQMVPPRRSLSGARLGRTSIRARAIRPGRPRPPPGSASACCPPFTDEDQQRPPGIDELSNGTEPQPPQEPQCSSVASGDAKKPRPPASGGRGGRVSGPTWLR